MVIWTVAIRLHYAGERAAGAIAALGAGIRSGSRADSRRLWRRQGEIGYLLSQSLQAELFAAGLKVAVVSVVTQTVVRRDDQRCSEIDGGQIEDSIGIIGSYSDVIVVRYPEAGGAQRAALVSPVPVINAGDGEGGQHPTQAVLDLYTLEASELIFSAPEITTVSKTKNESSQCRCEQKKIRRFITVLSTDN